MKYQAEPKPVQHRTRLIGLLSACMLLMAAYPSQLLALSYDTKVITKGGVDPNSDEATEARETLNFTSSYENLLVKLKAKGGTEYYVTEQTFIFHGNLQVIYHIYRRNKNDTAIIFTRTYEQEGTNTCAVKRPTKGQYFTSNRPAAFKSAQLTLYSSYRALLQIALINCETDEALRESINIETHQDYLVIGM